MFKFFPELRIRLAGKKINLLFPVVSRFYFFSAVFAGISALSSKGMPPCLTHCLKNIVIAADVETPIAEKMFSQSFLSCASTFTFKFTVSDMFFSP